MGYFLLYLTIGCNISFSLIKFIQDFEIAEGKMPTQTLELSTEQDYFQAIEGLGGYIWHTNHDLAHGRISADAEKGLAEIQTKLEGIVEEACLKFGIVPPHDSQPKEFGGPKPPIPEGKIAYWDWYQKQKAVYYGGEYNLLICSACPLSEGEEKFVRLGGQIPCKPFRGTVYKLSTPISCAMISAGDWTQLRLYSEIEIAGGKKALTRFLKKEAELASKPPSVSKF